MKTPTNTRALAALATLAVLPLAGCEDPTEATGPGTDVSGQGYRFSFESDLTGWTPDSDGTPGSWTLEQTSDLARHGGSSAALRLENDREDAHVWMEREFQLRPERLYHVEIEFQFASADWGYGKHWGLLTYLGTESPEAASDFRRGLDTGNGAFQEVGYRWRTVRMPATLRTGPDGIAHVAIGLHGNTPRSARYYVDNLTLRFGVAD